MIRPDWIAVDWGTSSLRAWAMTDDGQGLAMLCSDQGMGVLTPDQFEGALFDLIGDWSIDSHTPVIACGMVGAKQGWIETPYDTTPCKPQASMIAAPTQSGALNVQIIAGICQAKPADVMRGEETQIAGFLRLNPKWDGVVCLPGTHTKWVHVSAGEVVSFQTFMTGEMFALLSNQSVLRH
ncbi:MAG: 2-dehydro-3-deoxygalactonokinase, partial [Planktomarina sp.]